MTHKELEARLEAQERENAVEMDRLRQAYIQAWNELYLETHTCFVRMHDGYQGRNS